MNHIGLKEMKIYMTIQRLLRLWTTIVPSINYLQLMQPSENSVQQSYEKGLYRYLIMKEGKELTPDYFKSEEGQDLAKLVIEMRVAIDASQEKDKLTEE